ncbi:hypothetical protein CI109_103497 [Kwoniella shandongensis]|uniref:DNA polymerase eta n=1 Tax=Kwoniella shandongensis TaxID=1734106 RepID=A0A5M6C0E1_9TREE|nr:uncharacterized protein CI109_004600 [Kwoniella shandongensis]KAA5527065.1 hypothetical protein CI109_004600 [Kwoniella shandongensis]
MSFLAGPSKRHDTSASVPTYRHLLSPQAMTVSNPLRTIAHCDIDAAYAQFEQVRLGLPDDVPLICAQWQSIIAVNYPARKYGIKRFTTLDEARKMCPHLIVQHVATYRNGESEAGYWGEVDPRSHKVSLDPYRRESLKILAIFKEMVPRGEIEKASIDEAFLDLTPMVIERLLAIHPYLATVPDDAPEGLDSPLPPAPPINWSKAGNVFPINGVTEGDEAPGEEHEEQRSEDGEGEEAEERLRRNSGESWEDWALCIGAEIMKETREEVYRQLHYTCSAGIAHNKAMAKLCSAWKKPNNQTVLRQAATAAFLRDREFTDIRLLGGKLGNAMATEFDAKTVGDMLTVPLEEMQRRFGEESIWVYNILRGIDHTEVIARVSTKSMLASKNVRPNVTTPEQGEHWLSVLAGELNVRLREAREVAPGLWPKTLVLSHRQGIEPSRSRQTPFPFTKALSTEYIVKHAKKMWDEATQPMKNGNMRLNNIALSFTGLERLEEGQRGIETFFLNPKPKSTLPKERPPPLPTSASSSSSTTLPTLKRPLSPPHRSSSLSSAGPSPKKPRLPTLHTGKRKTVLESFLAKKNGESSSSARSESPSLAATPTPNIDLDDDDDDDVSPTPEVGPQHLENEALSTSMMEAEGVWKCHKCGAVLTAPQDREGERARVLADMKQEHEDWHYALSLQDGYSGTGGGGGRTSTSTNGNAESGNVRRSTTTTTTKSTSSVKRKKKPEGIKAFFTPKNK